MKFAKFFPHKIYHLYGTGITCKHFIHARVMLLLFLLLLFRVIKVAKQFTGDGVHFAVSDRDDMRQELEALGLSDKEPTAGIYDSKGKYSVSKDFSVDALKEFIWTESLSFISNWNQFLLIIPDPLK